MTVKVLLVTTNGTGMGHLARMTAVALAGREQLDCTILTFSTAAGLTHDTGVAVEYCPSRERGWHSLWHWDSYVESRLCALINEMKAQVVVFDGVMPYDGLIRASARNPLVRFVWCRRGMWRPGANRRALRRSRYFDLIVEPTDIAGAHDAGATVSRADATRIPPITLLNQVPRLSREQARAQLGLTTDARLVYFAAGSIRGTAASAFESLTELSAKRGWCVVTTSPTPAAPSSSRQDIARRFPLVGHLAAFDAAVCAAGYNAVHEVVAAGIPTLLLADSSVPTDDQARRATTAASCGYALSVDPADSAAVTSAMEQLLNGWQPKPPSSPLDGAHHAAAAIAATASMPVRRSLRTPALQLRDKLSEVLGPAIGPLARRLLGKKPNPGPRGRLNLGLGEGSWSVRWTDDVREVSTPAPHTVLEHVLPGTSSVYAQARRTIAARYYLPRM